MTGGSITRARGLRLAAAALLAVCACAALPAAAETAVSLPGVQIRLDGGAGAPGEVSSAIKVLLGLTVLSLAPAILMSMTSFIRIVVVLSMLRTALGMQETPPNTVLISLSLFLTLFTMSPVLQDINSKALQPYMAGKLGTEAAASRAAAPLREFMVRQTREQDLALMVELAKAEQPRSMDDISMVQLIPAFMLSELRAAFQIGFVIFLPFLLVDLIVSSALMALGMMMVPPASISLPLKILMFVLMDGWNLVVRSLLGTFL
ncbi:flagellar type III secretion system pore protein FliP [Pseudoduganella namucuonensis]|uniref:Flagellar biosynthetic protein FliP n=1 Tax=Pseudoduganella namucuonensis TaxID=1035707 RepID=A0A1I7M3X6_9BURK|nr:flagellar type III secretion system pore protein FliP [Pseudoduganella namucuonensis]SFV16634.1 flagellar biosynthetic protein FliP [Pseudoduganella namucuonensis]